ncbi:MAG: hypothetical protein ACRDBO_19765 [Lachnospiraceae bacterium]
MAYQHKMKYFIMSDEGQNPFPWIINWSQRVDIKKLTRDKYLELPSFIMLDMKLHEDGILPDIITSPFPLFSKIVMEVVNLYDSTIPFQMMALFDIEGKKSCVYYCPILLEEQNPMRYELPLFQIRVKGAKKTIIRLDLVESLLERKAMGIELKEI